MKQFSSIDDINNIINDEQLFYIVFGSADEAIKKLKVDRRRNWYEFMGNLIRDEKYKSPCWDCGGSGCQTCGYQKNTWQYVPVYAIDSINRNPVIIIVRG